MFSAGWETQLPVLVVQILSELPEEDDDSESEEEDEDDHDDDGSTSEWSKYNFASRLSLI